MSPPRSLLRTLVIRVTAVYLATFAIVTAVVLVDFRLGGDSLDRESLLVKAKEVATTLRRQPEGTVYPAFSQSDLHLFLASGAVYGMVVRTVPGREILYETPYRRLDIDEPVRDVDDDGEVVLTGLDRQTGERLFGVRRRLASPVGLVEVELVRAPGDLAALFHTLVVLWLEDGWPLFLVSLALVVLAILVTVRQTLAPLQRLSKMAAGIGADSLAQRLPLAEAPLELRPLVQAANQLLERLDAAFAAQRDFTANAAHELKTPLALAVSRLRDDASPSADVITLLTDTGRMVTQLLRLAEIESGALVQREPVALVPLVRTVTADAAPPVIGSGRELAFEGSDPPPVVLGHAALLEIALRNLLENARLHTPPGARITVSVHSDGEITVADDGPCIEPAKAARLFQPFTRENRMVPGAGLGLSIVARIASALGGEAGLRSPATGDPGNIFYLRLPLRA